MDLPARLVRRDDALHEPAVGPDPARTSPASTAGTSSPRACSSATAPRRRPTRSTARWRPPSGSARTTYVEEGPDDGSREVALLIVAGVAAFVTLVGVAISVALSAAEGRADLATLAAVGAPPRRRRALAAAQALLVAGLGCALGVAFGTFVAYAARTTTGSPDFVIPWTNLAITAIAVPLLAVLVAALFTPSRLPLVRRAT